MAPPVDPPPQPSKVVAWIHGIVLAGFFVLMNLWAPLYFGLTQATALGMLLSDICLTFLAFEAWRLFSLRLTEDGVWYRRGTRLDFMPWQGALIAARPGVLRFQNQGHTVMINAAVFASRRALLAFLARKFPPA